MENQEQIQELLTAFEKKPSTDIPPALEDYLRYVAKTGKILFPWSRVKALFVAKLEQVIEDFNKEMPYDNLPAFPNVEQVKFDEMRQRVLDAVHKFSGAPFTIQRMCELVTQSRAHYTRCDKFLRGIEKNVMVVTTVDPTGRRQESQRVMVNGLDLNGMYQESRSDINDFTGGLPFGKIAGGDWTNNSSGVMSLWPQATGGAMEGVASGHSSASVANHGEATNGGLMEDVVEGGASGSSLDTANLVVKDSCPAASSQLPASATSATNSETPAEDDKSSEKCDSSTLPNTPTDSVPIETATSTDSLESAASSTSDTDSESPEPVVSEMKSCDESEAVASEEVKVSEDTVVVEKRSAEDTTNEKLEEEDETEGPPVKKFKVDKNPDDETSNECGANTEDSTPAQAEVGQSTEESVSTVSSEEPSEDVTGEEPDKIVQPDSSTEEPLQEVSENTKTDIVDTCEDNKEVTDTDIDQSEAQTEAESQKSEVVSQEDMESKEHSAECEPAVESLGADVEGVSAAADTAEVGESETVKEELMDTDSNAEEKPESSEPVSTSEGEPMEQE